MGKVLIALGVIVALFIVGDALAREVAEDRVAGSLQASLDLSEKPDVSLSGWPFIFKALSGSFSEVKIQGEGVASSAVRISNIEVVLKGVKFPLGDALSGKGFEVEIEEGTGSVEIGESALQEVVAREQNVTVQLRGSRVTISGGNLPRPVEAQIELRGDHLVIVHEVGELSIGLPVIGSGVTYRTVSVAQGKVTVEFDLDGSALEAEPRN
jgi:LmeA-like phospholipid-binding